VAPLVSLAAALAVVRVTPARVAATTAIPVRHQAAAAAAPVHRAVVRTPAARAPLAA